MHCFPNIDRRPYVSNPFFVIPSILPVGTKVRKMQIGTEQEGIIEIQFDEAAKTRYKECCPINFGLPVSSTTPSYSGSKRYSSLASIPKSMEM